MKHRLAWHSPFSPKEIAKIPTERVIELRIQRKMKKDKITTCFLAK